MALAQRYPIERVASLIVAVWGICLILTTACFNYQTLYTERFFLGFLESGVSPMFMVIVVSRCWLEDGRDSVSSERDLIFGVGRIL